MNNEEFAKFLADLETVDAPQFEAVVSKMADMTRHVYNESSDPAYIRAHYRLLEVRKAIANRQGN